MAVLLVYYFMQTMHSQTECTEYGRALRNKLNNVTDVTSYNVSVVILSTYLFAI